MNNNNKGSELVNLIAAAAIGYMVGTALDKSPKFRVVCAVLVAGIGVWFFVASFTDGAGWMWGTVICFAIAALLIYWARQPVRARAAASTRFAAFQTPEAVAKQMEGTAVTSGPLVGWKVQVAHVVDNTFRAANGQVWADVDLILSNGAAQPATFHADTTTDTWEWAFK